MATDLTNLVDCGHWYGNDLALSPSGDLLAVKQKTRSQQRVLRRLLTSPGDYLAHMDYGAGLPQHVGMTLDTPALTGLVRAQMRLEASVARSPEPTLRPTPIVNGVSLAINYTVAPGALPAVVSFDATEQA